MTRYFHFTLGPVQGFVAQARRTRDFWAGSFLLSYLAGVAMREVIAQGGENAIIFPKPDESYLRWIDGQINQGAPPKHGGIPNRFMAKVSDEFQPSKVAKAVKTAWRLLAERVFENDLQGFASSEARVVWDRQINRFWEISWVLTQDEKATDLLDRRKNWRSHYLRPEPGMKCMAMEGMQELSGAERPGEGGEFWTKLRKRVGEADLRENERLCAIAYVKRRFVHRFGEGFKAAMPSGWTAHGWEVPAAVPSVTYIAAAPWLADVMRRSDDQALADFHATAKTFAGEGEWQGNLKCVRDADMARQWRVLDGHVFFEADLRNTKQYPDKRAEMVLAKLAELRNAAEPKLGPPAPYYALLLMDGDSLGKHMSDPAKRGLISAALNTFTGTVQNIVEQDHSGFLIYAGGDDVLALLSLDDALPCAQGLRKSYEDAFEQVKAEKPGVENFPATISAAIEYAHYRLPFTKVLADAHDLLDEVAKDGRGRDAVAARVWKQSGLHVTWAQPWEIALRDGGIPNLIGKLRNQETQVAGGFFYRMRDLFKLLNPSEGHPEDRIGIEEMVKLLAYEYAHSGIHGDAMKPTDAEPLIRSLIEQCQPRLREAGRNSSQWKSLAYQADAALLARFLASRGRERN